LTRLFEGDRLSQQLIPINGSGTELFLPGPGKYRFQATLRSEGTDAVGSSTPVWRGFVKSPELLIEVVAPSSAKLARIRGALQKGLEHNDMDFEAVSYFRLVRDSEAAEMLAALVRKVEINPVLIEAVARQNRSGDASALEWAASHALLPRDQRIAEDAAHLATQLRNPHRCD